MNNLSVISREQHRDWHISSCNVKAARPESFLRGVWEPLTPLEAAWTGDCESSWTPLETSGGWSQITSVFYKVKLCGQKWPSAHWAGSDGQTWLCGHTWCGSGFHSRLFPWYWNCTTLWLELWLYSLQQLFHVAFSILWCETLKAVYWNRRIFFKLPLAEEWS